MNDTSDNYERVIALMTSRPDIHIPARAHIDPRMTGALMRVYTSMCWHKNIDHVCWPSQTFLAAELGITQQAVSKSIRQLIAFGYVEILRRGFHGTGQTHVYRVITEFQSENLTEKYGRIFRHSENTGASAQGARPETSHLQPEVVSIYNPTLSHLQPEVVQKNTKEEYQRTSSSEDSYLPTTLAPSADNRAQVAVTAPPERRTRERLDESALRRDELFVALAACLGCEPMTPREWWQWRTALNNLHAAHATAADIPRAIRGYQAAFPRAKVTPLGLVNNWSLIWKGKTHDLAQLEVAQRATRVATDERREREHDGAEQREAQQREVERLLRELDDELRES